MKFPFSLQRRTLALAAVILPLLALFAYVVMRSGPMAPVAVTVAAVETGAVSPSLFGTGTIEARYVYRIGPTAAGRVKRVDVHVGDLVKARQAIGEIDPVDLDDRMRSQEASIRRAEANALGADAQLQDTAARARHAASQFDRYERLLATGAVSHEMLEARRQDRDVTAANLRAARANVEAAKEELARLRADGAAVGHQRGNLRLVSPVDGLVTARDAEPGTTVVAGQSVLEIVDPRELWVGVRFDQSSAAGLRAGLPATIVLRSRPTERFAGRVLRVEPRADSVTEEILAKVVIEAPLESLPPLGELAEVTASLPALPEAPVVPSASVQRRDGQTGVWVVEGDALRFRPVKLGAADLEGRVQVLDGLQRDARIVVHSERALHERSRFHVVQRMKDVAS